MFDHFLLPQESYYIVSDGGIRNVVYGKFSLLFCCFFSHASGSTTTQLIHPWEDVNPYEVGWAPSEVSCTPLEVFVFGLRNGSDMMPGVLNYVIH